MVLKNRLYERYKENGNWVVPHRYQKTNNPEKFPSDYAFELSVCELQNDEPQYHQNLHRTRALHAGDNLEWRAGAGSDFCHH